MPRKAPLTEALLTAIALQVGQTTTRLHRPSTTVPSGVRFALSALGGRLGCTGAAAELRSAHPSGSARQDDDLGDLRMLYMVIETFTSGAQPVYERAARQGRMLPRGLEYVDSWVDARRLDRCFQLMEADDPELFAGWMANWDDLVEFEIIPVVTPSEAASRALP